MSNSVRKNTVKLVFGLGSKVPSHMEVLKFVMEDLKLAATDIHTIYKEENGGQFYVKFMDEQKLSTFIQNSQEQYCFKYDDGSQTNVQVDQACRIFRYVRIFNLPPEIEDREIQYVLGQYGTIRQHVRERFPSEINVNIFTGVRGVHMEVSKEIPAHLYIGHFRARIFYEGLKNKCFYCKSEGHEKVNCPKLAAIRLGDKSSQPSGAKSLGRPGKPVIDVVGPTPSSMTVLTSKYGGLGTVTNNKIDRTPTQPLHNTSQTPAINHMEHASETKPTTITTSTSEVAAITQDALESIVIDHVAPLVDNGAPPETNKAAIVTETLYMDDEVSEQSRALVKRTLIISPEGSDSDEKQIVVSTPDGKCTKQVNELPREVNSTKATGSKRNKK